MSLQDSKQYQAFPQKLFQVFLRNFKNRELGAVSPDYPYLAIAWLLGYTAHMVADVTIHPIIELKVGEYAKHQREHRQCEMHQDSYIFQRLNLGKAGISEHFESGIKKCGKMAFWIQMSR